MLKKIHFLTQITIDNGGIQGKKHLDVKMVIHFHFRINVSDRNKNKYKEVDKKKKDDIPMPRHRTNYIEQ